MSYVKLDSGILNSTLWMDRDAREVFITSLLMAEPFELIHPTDQLQIRTSEATGWTVPAGWYGFVPAAGVGIGRQASLDREPALDALERLGSPEPDSRSPEYEGRRIVRVNGGFLILNYFKYRDRDYTAAERMRRLRERKAKIKADSVTRNETVTDRNTTVTDRNETVTDRNSDVTLRNADADADEEKKKLSVDLFPPPKESLSVERAGEGNGEGMRASLALTPDNGSQKPEPATRPPLRPPKRASALASKRAPPSFEPDRVFAARELPDMDIDREIQKFKDHEFRDPHTDWPATWRTWVLRNKESGRYIRQEAERWR